MVGIVSTTTRTSRVVLRAAGVEGDVVVVVVVAAGTRTEADPSNGVVVRVWSDKVDISREDVGVITIVVGGMTIIRTSTVGDSVGGGVGSEGTAHRVSSRPHRPQK